MASITQMAIPVDRSLDPAYTRVINDMSIVLADVLTAGYAYYAIIRGRGPQLYRSTWYVPLFVHLRFVTLICFPRYDIKWRVEGDPRAFFQAFHEGRVARKWYRRHKRFRVDLTQFPLPAGTEEFETAAPAPFLPDVASSEDAGGSGPSTT